MQSVTAFDHTLILVKNVDASQACMHRLGFRTTPKGVHSAKMGSENSTVMFGDMTYFEVIAPTNPTPYNERMRHMLARREGLMGYAMKTSDADACMQKLQSLSAANGDVMQFSRTVELPDGPQEAAFSIADIDQQKSLDLKMFACCHHTPDVVWRKDYLQHPNAAVGISDLFGEVADVDEAEAALRHLFAERVTRDAGAIGINYGNVQVTFLSPVELENRFGIQSVGGNTLHVLRLKTSDAPLTCSVLEENNVDFENSENNVWTVAPHEACGAMIQFMSQ